MIVTVCVLVLLAIVLLIPKYDGEFGQQPKRDPDRKIAPPPGVYYGPDNPTLPPVGRVQIGPKRRP